MQEQRDVDNCLAVTRDGYGCVRSENLAPVSGGEMLFPRSMSSVSGGRQFSASKFWHLPESTVLDLVALSAHAMRDIKPFAHHPSNASMGIEHPLCRRTRGASHAALVMPSPVAVAVPKKTESEPVVTARHGAHAACKSTSLGKSKLPMSTSGLEKAREKANFDELMGLFTPRLCWQATPEGDTSLVGNSEDFRRTAAAGGPA